MTATAATPLPHADGSVWGSVTGPQPFDRLWPPGASRCPRPARLLRRLFISIWNHVINPVDLQPFSHCRNRLPQRPSPPISARSTNRNGWSTPDGPSATEAEQVHLGRSSRSRATAQSVPTRTERAPKRTAGYRRCAPCCGCATPATRALDRGSSPNSLAALQPRNPAPRRRSVLHDPRPRTDPVIQRRRTGYCDQPLVTGAATLPWRRGNEPVGDIGPQRPNPPRAPVKSSKPGSIDGPNSRSLSPRP